MKPPILNTALDRVAAAHRSARMNLAILYAVCYAVCCLLLLLGFCGGVDLLFLPVLRAVEQLLRLFRVQHSVRKTPV